MSWDIEAVCDLNPRERNRVERADKKQADVTMALSTFPMIRDSAAAIVAYCQPQGRLLAVGGI